MRKTIKFIMCMMTMAISLNACSIFQPYDSDFLCGDGYPGDCSSVKEAYQKSFQSKDENFSPMVKNKIGDPPPTGKQPVDSEEYRYKDELYKEMAGLIKDPATPVLIPSKQLRVLIPGYADKKDNIYFSNRFVYFTARESRWALQPFDSRVELED